jgi:Mce-associated membrane protein
MRPATEEGTSDHDHDDKDIDMTNSITTTESDIAEESGDTEAADQSVHSEPANDSVTGDAPQRSTAKGRRVSVSVRSLAVGAVIVGLVAAVGVMTWLYLGTKATLDDEARQADGTRHAEQIALDYAVNAATMDYNDLGPWKQNLVKGTTPELNDKLTKAGAAMEQILLPLQWSSTAHPLAAKVRSHDNGVYVVDTFVGVMTKTVQAADSLQSTATYSITIDSNNAWQISDVGGIAAVVGSK